MSSTSEVLEENRKRRDRLLEGKSNCLLLPFHRFRGIYPGFEKSKYIIITANQKVGKSKLSDYLFIYEPLFEMVEHPEKKLKVKVLYFSLEMSAKEKINEFYCHLLFRLDGIRTSPRELRSVDKPCDPRYFELLESERYQKYIRVFEKMVTFNDTDKNPTGIYKECKKYALENGHENYITYQDVDELTGELVEKQKKDPVNPYTEDDEEEYRIILVDNAANIATEKDYTTRSAAIEKMSKYGAELKKDYKFIFVLIQHQAQAQEDIEHIKNNRMHPTSDGLGDCKTTTRDLNCLIGLYNPYKYGVKTHKDYNISKLGNFCRFFEIIEDRDYGAGGAICALFFDGATNMFKELPLPNLENKADLEKYYRYTERLMQQEPPSLELTSPQ